MGAVLICRDELVKSPYYIESMGIRLYSMEELAFFLYENIYLVDRQMLASASGTGFEMRPITRSWPRS